MKNVQFKLILSILISVFLIGCKSSGSNSSYGRYLDCQIAAGQIFNQNFNTCNRSVSRYEQSICFSKAYKRFSSDVCASQMAISLNSISEMYKQLAIVDDPANTKMYTNVKREEIYVKIKKLIDEEIEESIRLGRSDLNRRADAYYEARANANIASSFAILGAQQSSYQSNNNSPFSTYIINGRMISCMTTGNMTTCN